MSVPSPGAIITHRGHICLDSSLPLNGSHALEDGTTLRVSPKLFEALQAWEASKTAVQPTCSEPPSPSH